MASEPFMQPMALALSLRSLTLSNFNSSHFIKRANVASISAWLLSLLDTPSKISAHSNCLPFQMMIASLAVPSVLMTAPDTVPPVAWWMALDAITPAA